MNGEDNKAHVFNFRSGLKHPNEIKALQYYRFDVQSYLPAITSILFSAGL
jgi:hypothetical protein